MKHRNKFENTVLNSVSVLHAEMTRNSKTLVFVCFFQEVTSWQYNKIDRKISVMRSQINGKCYKPIKKVPFIKNLHNNREEKKPGNFASHKQQIQHTKQT